MNLPVRVGAKTKVLHVITRLRMGGAQDNTLLTTEGLDRARYDVHLASGPAGEWQARAHAACDCVFTIREMRREISPMNDWSALRALRCLVRARGYQIVHTHSTKAGVLGRLAAHLADVPIIVHTIHGFPWHDYMSATRKWFYILVERYAASLSDALITVSELNREQAVSLRLAAPEKLTTIYSGIDLARFEVSVNRSAKCDELSLDPDVPIVGTVGRLSKQKAPLDFVEAAKAVLEHRPNVQFVIVGDGPLTEEVRRATDGEHRIKMLGPRGDVPEILAILDVFALSSRWEGLGRALTEAMIMGRPVAATAVNGVPEIVAHGVTGLLSAAEAPDQLAENVLWLLQNRGEARQIGRRARERVVPAFSAARMVEQIDALYQRLLVEKAIR